MMDIFSLEWQNLKFEMFAHIYHISLADEKIVTLYIIIHPNWYQSKCKR